MKSITLNEYSDAGHGWLRVPKELIIELGIANKISGYSYITHNYVFLEEDCDYDIFLKACEGIYNIKTKSHYSEHSRIRSYHHYNTKYLKKFEVGTIIDTVDYGELTIYDGNRSRFYLKDNHNKKVGYIIKSDILGFIK